MSVQQHLLNVASKAILSSSEKASINTSLATMRTRLDSHFGAEITEKVQFGSSTRETILPRLIDAKSDIDYMVVFSDSQFRPQTYLDRLRRFVEAKYYSSDVAQSSPTIVLNLNHIKFELVPAVRRSFSGLEIPSPASDFTEWTPTDPTGFNNTLVSANISHSGNVKRMIRVIKYWNARNGYPFNSYLLEQNLVNYVSYEINYKNYVFAGIRGLSLPWDASSTKRNKLDRAKEIVDKTIYYENNDMPASAEAEIKKLVPVFW